MAGDRRRTAPVLTADAGTLRTQQVPPLYLTRDRSVKYVSCLIWWNPRYTEIQPLDECWREGDGQEVSSWHSVLSDSNTTGIFTSVPTL